MRYTLLQFLLSLQLEIARKIIQFGLSTRAQRNEDKQEQVGGTKCSRQILINVRNFQFRVFKELLFIGD